MKANFKNIIALVLIVVLAITMASALTKSADTAVPLQYSDVIQMFRENRVTSFSVDGNLLISLKAYEKKEDGTLGEEKSYTFQLSYAFQMEQINDLAKATAELPDSNLKSYDFVAQGEAPWYQIYLPYIILTLIFIGLWIFMMKQSSGGGIGKMNSFSKSRAKVSYNEKNPVKFADVAGADEEKAELEEVVELL